MTHELITLPAGSRCEERLDLSLLLETAANAGLPIRVRAGGLTPAEQGWLLDRSR